MFFEVIQQTIQQSGFMALDWRNATMIVISFVLMYMAVAKGFEPLLLLPIAFGMFLANIPLAGLMTESEPWYTSGILRIIYSGVKSSLFPCLIFMGVGAMTDFGPLIANPASLLLGAAAQFGIFVAFTVAIAMGFTPQEAASIGIIGGADGPTAIYTANNLAQHLTAPIAVAAYSYMALIPLIQPPIMKALTTPEERKVKMGQLRKVSKAEKVIFPAMVVLFCALLLPSVAPLLGMLMLGNIFKESGVTDRLSSTAQNELCNIVTIMLGTTVGATANGEIFLSPQTLMIVALGLTAFAFATAGGVILGKIMYRVTGGKINPLIGSAGVSAVPMAARVSQVEGAKYNPTNFLLMHAMGPNVAGVIGSAVAAGFFLLMFK
ncbi:sodium ion-translocating decarboxylase subunit beta [Criibacterium bergeronii]|uniref:Sodium ion-translocating decarboxylase subunit beta n=1 Tax=Criibacterium bergeronii TaxID=1871336 RepID=A0A371IMV4_9FIRM|nr:sodium ion-translocating decarboxylase subunit beta [Criibacterium bergeronii]MBS6063071.1 sodium ion-translocating decarboxylase subunit beta [Peptostreptococcaceae bacterium]RDY21817.1 sodium ion-translocating decarboxylase subunit beta [Criibacterium bergeronii]